MVSLLQEMGMTVEQIAERTGLSLFVKQAIQSNSEKGQVNSSANSQAKRASTHDALHSDL